MSGCASPTDRRSPRTAIRAVLAALVLLVVPLLSPSPAGAAVTLTFWSHEHHDSYPHAFVTLRGVPDEGGPPVDFNVGFTARRISMGILFGSVDGMLEAVDTDYLRDAVPQFSVTLSDAQYARVLGVLAAFGPGGDQHYNLNKRNCVTMTRLIADQVGLTGTDLPQFIKKPDAYLEAVAAANPGRIAPIGRDGAAYLATLRPVPGVDPAQPILDATGWPTPARAFEHGGPWPLAVPVYSDRPLHADAAHTVAAQD